jgi:hypothetical protein
MAEHSNTATRQETQKRFRFFLIAFRVAGIPILFNKVPTLFKVYAKVATFCCYVTIMAVVVDMFMNTEDLERTMDTVRVVFPVGMIVWIHIFMR